ncbi:MAG: tRNA (guanosine(37)-N1)-methyltransferase TrmD [Gammaproteobacteria bacterium]|nr:tRNA (guanosine(37)-N1)-methyltransferase TrmD [Gammaproteobacteria bacterium]TVQ49698.1 MAG: tRNA (guanosine(37)-N1)-methyltransferase TrmD [Gammaproteobacteria bacterium]
MLKFALVALLPELVRPVTEHGVVGRAFARGLASLTCHDPRQHAADRHRTVDDRSYGGGPGMVLKYAPMAAAIREAMADLPPGSRRLVLAAHGRRFDQAQAAALAASPGVLLVAGRYEGLDERLVEAFELEPVSLGDYVLSGGELAAAVIIDGCVRLLPGALGDEASAMQDSFVAGLLDCPHYTRPERIEGREVPQVLLGGDHAAVRRWRLRASLARTLAWRPELLVDQVLDAEQRALLEEVRREADAAREGHGIQGPRRPAGEDDEQAD